MKSVRFVFLIGGKNKEISLTESLEFNAYHERDSDPQDTEEENIKGREAPTSIRVYIL